MSKKNVCSIPWLWTIEEYARHRCDDNSHKHLSRAQVVRYERQGRVRWLRRADSRGFGAVLKLTAAPVGSVIDRVAIRGVSCRIGEALVLAADRGELWARVMLSDMSTRGHGADRMEANGSFS